MTTASEIHPIHTADDEHLVAGWRRPSPAPLLVASDGSESSDGAVWAAMLIARRAGREVHVLAVQEPLPMMAPEVQMATSPADDFQARESLRHSVLGQLARARVAREWRLEVVTGDPAMVIAATAERLGAELVVMGLGGHGLFERVVGDEMVLRVIRLGRVPVLAVGPDFIGLPRRIVSATDFSASSLRALEIAASLAATDACISVAHVLPSNLKDADWTWEHAALHGAVGRAFDTFEARAPEGVTLERRLLYGDAAGTLIKFAENERADLIATGSHGHAFLSRLWLGSVSQRLVRDARRSILIAPPLDGPGYAEELPSVTSRFGFYEWAERLEEVTRRNAGRPTTLEVIDPDVGAQVVEQALPLVGVDFDHRDGNAHVMLGDPTSGGRHLTRVIPDVKAVQVLRGRHGKDVMLRFAHGSGQTLLTFG